MKTELLQQVEQAAPRTELETAGPGKTKNGIVQLDHLIRKVERLPVENFFIEGIKEHSLNFIIAPPKVGKTTMAENIGMCVAAGYGKYLDKDIWTGENKKVMVISLEEYYRGRTERNAKQMEYMDTLIGNKDWHGNFLVSDTDSKRYISLESDWEWLMGKIKRERPALTVIDSLSRMHGSSAIEDSCVALPLMKRLRKFVEDGPTTLIVIHHTHKMGYDPITLSNMAGSRIIGQEADSIIALNKTPKGKRYMKPLAYRYADDNCENVLLLKRNSHHWLESVGEVSEYRILREFDNRTDDSTADAVLDYIFEYTQSDNSIIVESKGLIEQFVDSGRISRPTLFKAIDQLKENGSIIKQARGRYSLPQA